MSNGPGPVTGRPDKASWAPVGGPVSLHDEGGVWLNHRCICAEAKGSIHSLTLHVDTLGINVLKTGPLANVILSYSLQTALNEGIYVKHSTVLGTF